MEGSRRGTSQGRLLDLVLAGVLSNDDPVERYGELEILGHGSTSEVILHLHVYLFFLFLLCFLLKLHRERPKQHACSTHVAVDNRKYTVECGPHVNYICRFPNIFFHRFY